MPKLLSAPSPQPIRCLLQAPRKSVSLSSPRQYFVSSPVRPLAQPRHGILHDPWPTPTSPTLFSQTHLESSIDGLNGGPQNDHKPPDERILKLGKSTCDCPRTKKYIADEKDGFMLTVPFRSATHSLSSTTDSTHQSFTSEHTFAEHHTSLISLDASAPPHSERSHIVSSRALDRPCGVEQLAASR